MQTKKLADFTANLKFSNLSEYSILMAKKCLLDWLGVSIRGSQEKPASIIRQIVIPNSKGDVTVLDGKGTKASVMDAAFCNGAASHCLDFDDLHNPSIIHLATVVVPGVVAIAEAEHRSGKEILTAICAGYEAGARVGEAVIPESYFFWHTTGTAGTFGAAAAAANILGLTPEQTLMCYGSAGTQAAGLWEFLKEGAMSKALHAGKSSYAGVLSAYLSQAGFTGATKILEGEKGFCRAMVREPHLEKLTDGLGNGVLKIDENSFKPYACCKHSHAAIYAIQVLREKYKMQVEQVEKITLHVNEITNYLINNPEPQNAYGCKFSIQYCVAAMFCCGAVGIEQFTDIAIKDETVRKLMRKVTVVQDEEMEKIIQQDASKLASAVEITLNDGTTYAMQVDYPKGDPDNPFTWEDACNKFLHLASAVYGEERASKLCNLVADLENCPDFAEGLVQALQEE